MGESLSATRFEAPEHPVGEVVADVAMPTVNPANCIGKVLRGAVLRDISHGAAQEAPKREVLLRVHAEDDRPDSGV